MSNNVTVNSVDIQQVKKLLKDCPKDVQQYVKALENLSESNGELIKKCVSKIRELSK